MTGFNVSTQVPLDFKTFFNTRAELINLGVDSNYAFKYYKGMLVYCDETKSIYVWDEAPDKELCRGEIPNGFTYPANIATNGVDYSNKKYNFYFFSKKTTLRYVVGYLDQVGENHPEIKILDHNFQDINLLTVERLLQGSYVIYHPIFQESPENVIMLTNNFALDDEGKECFIYIKNQNDVDGINIQTYARTLDSNLQDDCLTKHKFIIYFVDFEIQD